MKIGCTAGVNQSEKIRQIAEAGYDYIEAPLANLVCASDDEVREFLKALEKYSIPCTAANMLFPCNMRLTGEGFNASVIEDYLNVAFERAQEVGIETVVFGSGAARRIPDGFDRNVALEQIKEVCMHYLSPVARKNGITVAIENLNSGETNLFNTVSETADFVGGIACDNIKVLCNNFQMVLEQEEYSVIRKIGKNGIIALAHVANPDRIGFPTVNDPHDYSEFFDSLKNVGYEGGITVDVGVPDDENTEEGIYAASIFLKTVI